MRFIDLIRRSARSLRSARARTILTALAIAVGAFALTLTLGATNGAQNYADTIVRQNFDPSELIVTADGDLFKSTSSDKPQEYNQNFGTVSLSTGSSTQVKMLTDSDITNLRHLSGVGSVQPLSTLSLQYVTRDGQRKYTATAQAYDNYTAPKLLAGSTGKNLAAKQVILPEGFVTALGFSSPRAAIGQPIRLSVQRQVDQSSALASLLSGNTGALRSQASADNSMETQFTVVAVSKTPSTTIQPAVALYLTVAESELASLNDYSTAGTSNYHKYLSATVKVTDGTDTAKLNATQATVKRAGYAAQSVVDTEKTITQVINVLQGIVLVFGLIAVVASIFGVVNTMYISVLQRTREIGLMKALGMHKRDINKLFLFEAGLIGFLGGLLGALVAVVLGTALNPFISDKLQLDGTHLIQFKPIELGLLILVLTIVAIFAGLLPARKAARLDPITALRTE